MLGYIFHGYIPWEGIFAENPTFHHKAVPPKRIAKRPPPVDVGPFTEFRREPRWYPDPIPGGRKAFNLEQLPWERLEKIIAKQLKK